MTRSGTRTRASAAAAPTAGSLLEPAELRAARDALEPARPRAPSTRRSTTSAASPRPSDRASTRTDDRAGHRDRAPLDAARPRRRLRPGRLGALPVVARDDRRPGPGRRRRRDRRRVARPTATATSNPVLLGAGGPPGGRCVHRRRRRAGDRRARLRAARGRPRARRPDRRARQRLGDRGQDRGLRRGRHRPAGRAVRGHGPRRAARGPGPRRGRPHHPGRARPRLAGDPGHDGSRRSPTRSRRESRRCSATRPRRDILGAALARPRPDRPRPDLDAAIAFVNAYAPEHLSVDVEPLEATVARAPQRRLDVRRRHGRPKSAGDYATGANHVLPTGGLARSSGALAVETYGKFIQVQRIDRAGLASIRDTVATLAEAEGLHAHRDAVEIRFDAPARSRGRR